jgi:hypothetical protein
MLQLLNLQQNMKNVLILLFLSTFCLAQPPARVLSRDLQTVKTATVLQPNVVSLVKVPALFEVTASQTNTKGHILKIDNPLCNGNPNAVVFAMQKYGNYNANEIGVWYDGSSWTVFNQNRQPLPLGCKFNILAFENPSGNVFTHTTQTSNIAGHVTTIDNPQTNGKGDIIAIVSQNYGKYNTSPVGLWWNNGKWTIFNQNFSPMPAGTKFNVLVLKGDVARKYGEFTAIASQQKTEVSNRKMPHLMSIDNSAANNNINALVFTTPKWIGTYNVHPVGVWYSGGRWTVFNENQQEMKLNNDFNIVAFSKEGSGSDTKSTPVVKKVNTYDIIKNNPNILVIRPKFELPGTTIPPQTPPPAPESIDPLGPKMNGIPHLIRAEVSENFRQVLTRINLFDELYEDKNPKSNIYYYLPAKYSLKWDSELKNYSFSVYYLSAADGSRGSVIVTAKLFPNIREEDVILAEKLLAKTYGKEVKLRSLTMLLKDTPKVNFGSALSNFDVKNESINITVPSDVFSPIIMSWRMDSRVEDLIGAMMNDQGLSGNITFSPMGDVEKNISVIASMKVNEAQTFGQLRYDDGLVLLKEPKNNFDYPITLKNLLVLKKKDNGTNFNTELIKITSISSPPNEIFRVNPLDIIKVSKATMVEPMDFVNDKRDSIRKKEIESIWVDYSVDNCADCNLAIQQKILNGTTSSKIQKISLEVMNPLEFTKASAIKMQIKSVMGDPNGKSEQLLPTIDIKEDLKSISGGDLFVTEGKEPAFDYKIYVLMKDGTLLESDWITHDNLILTLGEAQIKELFSQFANP